MNIKEARQLLHEYNQWRRWPDKFRQPDHVQTTEAIRLIINYLKLDEWADGLDEKEEIKRKYENECG